MSDFIRLNFISSSFKQDRMKESMHSISLVTLFTRFFRLAATEIVGCTVWQRRRTKTKNKDEEELVLLAGNFIASSDCNKNYYYLIYVCYVNVT